MSLILAVLLGSAAPATHATSPARSGSMPPAPGLPVARLPGFAAELADRPMPYGLAAWPSLAPAGAWAAIAASAPADRQSARWAFAQSLVARGASADALGVLEVMASDDPDLVLVPAWQRARGAALVGLGRSRDALDALDRPQLARDPEACLWRMRAAADAPDATPTDAAAALRALACAVPALNARDPGRRTPFVLAAARAALAAGRPEPALRWLGAVADGDPDANLLRGDALRMTRQFQPARLRYARAEQAGGAEQKAAARFGLVRLALAAGTLPPAAARERLEVLDRRWRGGDTDRDALMLATDLSERAGDDAGVLRTGAILFRYFDLGDGAGALAARLQAALARALAPSSHMPLAQAAGLFWDYRDAAPGGADGVRLAEALVTRLQAAGLYGRAADLLQFRLDAAGGVEQGPLSVRVATMRVLEGDPAAAIRMLRATDAYPYPAAMTADRRRVEAAALDLLGRTDEAVAALDDVPNSAAEQAEVWWRARDWEHLVAAGEPALPAPGRLSEVGQALVLRRAVALAMLGREAEIARLRGRYAASFATLPTAATFAMLTGDPSRVTPEALARAMASLPTASPAGAFADLLDGGAEARGA